MFRDARVYPATTCFHPRFCSSFASDSKKPKKNKNTSSQRNKTFFFFLSQIRAKKLRTRHDQFSRCASGRRRCCNGSSAKLEKFHRHRRCLDSGQVEQSRQTRATTGKPLGYQDACTNTHRHNAQTQTHMFSRLESNQNCLFFLFFFSLHPPF